MRVVHLCPYYWPTIGGGEVHCQQVSEALERRGHEVHVVTTECQWPLPLQHRKHRRTKPVHEVVGGIHVHRLRLLAGVQRLLPWMYRLPVPARANVRRILRRRARRDYDPRVAATVADIAPDVVLSVSVTNPMLPALLDEDGRCRWPLALMPLHHIGDPNQPLDKLAQELRIADVVLANTQFEADEFSDTYGTDPKRIAVVGVGAEVPEAAGPHPRAPRVLFLGRKSPGKGIQTLLDEMRAVWAARPDARLVLAGARRTETVEVDAMLAALPPADRARVDTPEDLDEADKASELARAACLVLPSKSESFGMVLLEAWGHGTPIVTYDLPVFRCTVTPGKDGFLVPDEVGAMGQAILALVNDSERCAQMGAAGRRRAEAHPTWDDIAARHEALYERAIRCAGTPRPAPAPADGGAPGVENQRDQG